MPFDILNTYSEKYDVLHDTNNTAGLLLSLYCNIFIKPVHVLHVQGY